MIKRILREHRFDIAYVNNVFQADVLIKAACDIPMVYVFHASAHREITIDLDQGKYGRMSWMARVANSQVRRVEERVISGAQSIVVRSEFMREELDGLYGGVDKSKVQCIPLGVDMERFGYAEDTTKVRRELALDEDRPVLLTVRRLVARMGIENLIMALRKVADRFPNVLLVIGGTGYLERELKGMIAKVGLEKNISMLGFIPENILARYYQAADLFVLPTLAYEGFGRSTIEALSCGTPAIVTPVGANPEVMSPLGEKYLFKGSDSNAICDGITAWLEKGVGVESRKQCRSYCFERFSQEKVCGDLEDVLDVVANRHSAQLR
jgi:glycosyltransferase involved in cell wall biosynthesis